MSQKNVHLPQSGVAVGRRFIDIGLNWYDTHRYFAERGAQMPLFREYCALFSEPLQNSHGIPYSDKRARSFRTSLLRKRDTAKIEWIDALFIYKDNQWYLHQKHILVKGRLEAQEKIPLTDFLQEDGMVALDVLTENGWPSSKLSGSKYTAFS